MSRFMKRLFNIVEEYEIAIAFAQANDAEGARRYLS